jgi:hypothetical protein
MSNLASDDPGAGARLIRCDRIEAWAPRAFALESLPGLSFATRQAILCLYSNGVVHYAETFVVGLRGFRAKRWTATIADMGVPMDPPVGFLVAKGLHLRGARNRSFVARVDGTSRIIWFTGVTKPEGLPPGTAWMKNIPNAGPVIGWAEAAVVRARNPRSGHVAADAAATWRTVLSQAAAEALPAG